MPPKISPPSPTDIDEDSVSDSVQENSWFYDGELERSEVNHLEPKERNFWEDCIEEFLKPIVEDKSKKVSERIFRNVYF